MLLVGWDRRDEAIILPQVLPQLLTDLHGCDAEVGVQRLACGRGQESRGHRFATCSVNSSTNESATMIIIRVCIACHGLQGS